MTTWSDRASCSQIVLTQSTAGAQALCFLHICMTDCQLSYSECACVSNTIAQHEISDMRLAQICMVMQQYLPSCCNRWNSPFVDSVHVGFSQSCQHGTSDDAVVHALRLGFVKDHLDQFTQPLQNNMVVASHNRSGQLITTSACKARCRHRVPMSKPYTQLIDVTVQSCVGSLGGLKRHTSWNSGLN